MPGFETHSQEPAETENVLDVARNARHGLKLFAFYFVVYAGFVILSAFFPGVMEKMPGAGINLAIWYGFALIFGALVISLLYGWLCQTSADDDRRGDAA